MGNHSLEFFIYLVFVARSRKKQEADNIQGKSRIHTLTWISIISVFQFSFLCIERFVYFNENLHMYNQ